LLPWLKARARQLRQKWRGADLSGVAARLEQLDETYVEEGAKDVTQTDVERVVEQADAIEERFRDNGPLRRLLEDGRLLMGLVRDVRQGRYRDVPVWTLSAAVFALLYVLNPLDVIPDALPVLGVLDDAAVVSACLALLEQDLYDYREWRRGDGRSSDSSRLSESDRTEEETSG
jgi:uncharacterized membrane protein YkvA (DUF1232 family)